MPPVPAILRAFAAATISSAAVLAVELADGIQLHGFLSQGYLHTTGTDWYGPTSGNGTFEFNEAALNVTAQPIDRLRLGVQIMARDLADSGNDAVTIELAYADYRLRPEFGAKVGRFKMPIGLYNESQDIDFDHASVFLPLVIYQPQFREYMVAVQGGMVYGSFDSRRAGTLDYHLYGGGQNVDPEGDLATYFHKLGAGDTFSSMHLDSMAGATLTWRTPIEGLRARVSGLLVSGFEAVGHTTGAAVAGAPGVYADSQITTTIPQLWNAIASIEYQHRGLTLACEVLNTSGEEDVSVNAQPYVMVPTGLPPPLNGTTRVDLPAQQSEDVNGLHDHAAYLSAAYRVIDRFELSASRQIRNESNGNYDHSWCFAARYDIFDNWLVKAEWQLHHGDALATEPGIESWTLFALRTTVDF